MSFLQLRFNQLYVIISTQAVSGITSSGGTANGTLSSARGAVPTEMGFVYSTSPNPTTSDTKVTVSYKTGTYSGTLSGLASSTTYHVRSYVIDGAQTVYGDDFSFATSSSGITAFGSTLLMLGVG